MNRIRVFSACVFLCLFLLLGSACSSIGPGQDFSFPRNWDHVVLVVLENEDAQNVSDLPFLKSFRQSGWNFANYHAVARPSQPNYFALFSGDTWGIADDFSHNLAAANLQTKLESVGKSFKTFAQSIPSTGFRGDAYPYLRKHNPAASFSNVADASIVSLDAFPSDAAGYASLPNLSFVIPDMVHDMHDNSPQISDTWLAALLDAYISWAKTNNSVCIITFDEPDPNGSLQTPIYTAAAGSGLSAQILYTETNHYQMYKALLKIFDIAEP